MLHRFLIGLVLLSSLLGGCHAETTPARVATPPMTIGVPAAPDAAGASSPAAGPQVAGASAVQRREPAGEPCGALDCRLFDSPEQAFSFVLEDKPLLLAVGEAHAPRGSEGIESSAKRFTQKLLPLLQGKASDLLIEIMLPPKGCKAEEQEARVHQKEVTQQQASTNQNEYVVLGEAARKLGVVPDALRPTCADLDAANAAGDGAVLVMLATIGRLTGVKARDLLARDARVSPDAMVVTYGGAMHNDVTPREDRKDWSFGPELVAATGGRYVELDMFVPEYIRDDETWRALEFYSHYDKARFADRTVLFHPRAGSYVMVFPRSPAGAPASP